MRITPSFKRMLYATLAIIFALATVVGLYWLVNGVIAINTPPTSGEDLGPETGYFFALMGGATTLIGGLFALLFTLLCKSTTKQIKTLPK